MPIDLPYLPISEQLLLSPSGIYENVDAVDFRNPLYASLLRTFADRIEADVTTRMENIRKGFEAVFMNAEGRELVRKNPDAHVFLEELMAKQAAKIVQKVDRIEKSFQRDLKRSPELVKYSPFHTRIIAAGRREIEDRLDQIMWLRAIRAEVSGADRGGPEFSDPKALAKYLSKELA